jgi:PAS domain S-box-containing protein
MKPVHSLQFKISAVLFLVGTLLIVISTMRLYYRAVQVRRWSAYNYAFAEGSRLSGMAQHLLRRQVSRAADLELSYAATNPDLRQGVILDAQDVVRHATSQQFRGLSLKDTPMWQYASIIQKARDSMDGGVQNSNDRKKLIAVFPFWEGLAKGKGCVVMEYDLKAPLALASEVAMRASVAQALVLAGGCIALWLLLEIMVTRRVEALVKQVEEISLDGSPGSVLGGRDELSQVSQAIFETHQRLQHSELRFRQITSTMRDVFWLAPANPDQIPYANAAYRAFFGRDEKRLYTRRWDWLHAVARDDRRRCLEMLQALRNDRKTDEVEARITLADGSQRWVRCRGFAMVTGSADGHAVAGIAMDVSERKTLERRLLDATEKERRRIGMDLHDDLCQRLAAALMKTGVLQCALARGGSTQAVLASDLAGDLSDATGVARGFARGLAPVGIEALGLPAALSDLGEFISKGFQVPCRVECNASDSLLAGESATHIFRVAQELATNAAKHANADWIEITCEMAQDEVRLMIAHNGAPYRPEAVNGEGMGMHLVRQRLDALGASISFHSPRPDDSITSVECLIPLRQMLET